MSKYRVKNTCYGFQGRYWTAGEVVDISPNSEPPVEHFEPLEKVDVPVAASEPPPSVDAVVESAPEVEPEPQKPTPTKKPQKRSK